MKICMRHGGRALKFRLPTVIVVKVLFRLLKNKSSCKAAHKKIMRKFIKGLKAAKKQWGGLEVVSVTSKNGGRVSITL